MLGPFATASRSIAIHQVSLLSHAACASMSTTTTTTRDRGDRYGPNNINQRLSIEVIEIKRKQGTKMADLIHHSAQRDE